MTDTTRASRTWAEIHAQPAIWRDWANALDVARLRHWIADQGCTDVWFCGAGSSAYIGDILAAGLPQGGPVNFRSVPSTDLVARPHAYLADGAPPLLVNFGRSGNSSETIGTLRAVQALAPQTPMLNITCNEESALADSKTGRPLLLPSACHDTGFAMTSSFTTMLLTALSLFDDQTNAPAVLKKLADLAQASLAPFAKSINAMPSPQRAVFVGSGPMAFAARECALKGMELSGGAIPALWESTLGFRHGPKSFVLDQTAIFVLLSPEPYALKYDSDLVVELKDQFPRAGVYTIGAGGDFDTGTTGSAVWDTALSVLPAQLAAAIWSGRLGLSIDDPFAGRATLTRVVSGVRLHPVEGT